MTRASDQRCSAAPHRRRRKTIPFALCWGLLVWGMRLPSARAQGDEREARRQFDEGVSLLHDDRFAEALLRFERARGLREVPAVMLNLAIAQRGVGRFVDADRSLARYLELARGRVDRGRASEVERLRAEIRAAIASLSLRVQGNAETVSLDGRALSPSERSAPIELDPGEHVVELTGQSVEPERVPFSIARGQALELPVRARPRDLRARLTIEAPPDATVILDRRVLGTGRQEVMAAAGVHEVRAQREGYEPFHATVTSIARRDERVTVTMRRAGGSNSILTRWWFWTGLGVIAAGTAVAVVYATRPLEAPDTGSLGYAVGAQVVW